MYFFPPLALPVPSKTPFFRLLRPGGLPSRRSGYTHEKSPPSPANENSQSQVPLISTQDSFRLYLFIEINVVVYLVWEGGKGRKGEGQKRYDKGEGGVGSESGSGRETPVTHPIRGFFRILSSDLSRPTPTHPAEKCKKTGDSDPTSSLRPWSSSLSISRCRGGRVGGVH